MPTAISVNDSQRQDAIPKTSKCSTALSTNYTMGTSLKDTRLTTHAKSERVVTQRISKPLKVPNTRHFQTKSAKVLPISTNVRWKPSFKSHKAGIDANVCKVLTEAWQRGFTTKSDFSRELADYVAIAACMGWVTTRIFPPDVWGSTWQITSKGLLALEELYGINTEEDSEEND